MPHLPSTHLSEEEVRRDRLSKIQQQGISPYPTKANRTHTIADFLTQFETSNQLSFTLVGRILTIRKHGGLLFFHLKDETGRVQVLFKRDLLTEALYNQFCELLDMGDYIEVTGKPFVTQKGEQTLQADSYKLISKTILPLPEKWHGFADPEKRFRKRYLDILMNEEVAKRLRLRSKIISSLRNILDERGFLEVETPTLQPVYGGGFAKPFKTHHNALDQDFYLRISDELYLKRLLVGGFEKIYEITKVFRNEGIDHDHNPEFTMLEAQIAYEDYLYGMDLFEMLFESTAQHVLGTTKIQHEQNIIDVKRPWKRLRLIEAVESIGNIPITLWENEQKARDLIRSKITPEKYSELDRLGSIGEIMAFAFEELVEDSLIQPTIIYDYPVEVSPLAKKNQKDPRFVERFEAFALGSEIGNNYSELNDPIDLEERFLFENKKEQAGFEEAHQKDFGYLEAIKHGMPPACGIGIGVDRMVMLLTGTSNIKEVILFPTLRSQETEDKEDEILYGSSNMDRNS
ncbi:lysine--tRNA ligase [Candidatus Uhrbacteria bacterium CG_4_9_14_3_um_filter_36_7]|uniref:Lysine--tRNA ligase n=1 Tax=Candidatus Uhrbacteria bacterium CG_4_9_14_3_um_filter_36_7 TaxID=1975033 RepID=A0A2M7XIG4_9BACT|nr:MAG: lysine--tRNA ligase [Candidatus Uhrbacteria bacterium CG_4_9_14_3_um_filter_36_7]